MADQQPRMGNFTKLFVPGLAVGLLIGGVGGAYLSGRMEASDAAVIPSKPARVVQKDPALSGSTGETGATGQTGDASAAPSVPPAQEPK